MDLFNASLGSAHIVEGDARALPLAEASVDLIVTSPPYWALRKYEDGGAAYDGQIGAEETPALYLEHLWEVMAALWRVLKPTGSVWVNLGDKFNSVSYGSHHGEGSTDNFHRAASLNERNAVAVGRVGVAGRARQPDPSTRTKSLMGLPWRFAIGCIDDNGFAGGQWILREEVIWAKPNGLPESVRDRCAKKHEQWFHFTKSERYFADLNLLREPIAAPGRPAGKNACKGQGDGPAGGPSGWRSRNAVGQPGPTGSQHTGRNPLGKLPGSVWTVGTEPLNVPKELGVEHFAAFPSEFPRRIISGWSPVGICPTCGEGLKTTVEKHRTKSRPAGHTPSDKAHPGKASTGDREAAIVEITGYACGCGPRSLDDPTLIPAVVLDPFGGTGTTAAVAKALGRTGVSVDMSSDYSRLAEWRTNDETFKAKVVERTSGRRPRLGTPQQSDGQLSLFATVA